MGAGAVVFLPFEGARCSTDLVLRLVKLFFFAAGMAAFAWFGLTVPLGERTLFQHFSAIGSSQPSQDLLRGAKDKVGEVRRRLGEGGSTGGEVGDKAPVAPGARKAGPAGTGGAPRVADKPQVTPSDELTQTDRQQMRRMIENSRRQARN